MKKKTNKSRLTTREPLNVDALRDLASRKAAGVTTWPVWQVSIRTVLQAYLACVEDGHLEVAWSEWAHADEFGFETRRYSGKGEGVAGRSLFCLPGLLRACGRQGLHNTMDIDQDNAHFEAQSARHPGKHALLQYIRDKGGIRDMVARSTGVDNAAAKQLFLRLAYGGDMAAWCRDHKVDIASLPPFVAEFAAEQKEIRAEDAQKHPDLLAKCRLDSSNPEATLQSYLNMQKERVVLNSMESAVQGMGRVAAYEHDGLFLVNPRLDPNDAEGGRAWREAVLQHMQERLAVPISVKEPQTFEQILLALEGKFPGADWRSVDSAECLEQGVLIAEAIRLQCKPGLHQIYSRIVALEAQALLGYPWSVRELFKHKGGGQYYTWDVVTRAWTTEDARDRLLGVICDVLGRRIRGWTMDFVEEGGMTTALAEVNPQFLCVGLAESVEKLIRPLLRDRAFELDGEDARRYLVFENLAFDRDTGGRVELSPAIRSSHTTGWVFNGSGLSGGEEEQLHNAIKSIAVDELVLSDNSCAALDNCSSFIPALAFLKGICGTWERALYCAKHLARATFALPYQEHLWTRGPGANGKDTLANLMQSLLGGYFANLPCEALMGSRDMDAPSQTLLALKGKRFAAVREIAKGAKIRSHVYKTISDPKGKLKARGLYGADVEFSPHFLMYICTNVPVDIDDSSGGSARRTRILDLPFNFVEEPCAANERQKDVSLELQFPNWRSSFFALLVEVHQHFLTRNQSNVTPVPPEVVDAVEEELEEPWMALLEEFVRDRLVPATKPADATSAAEVRGAFYEHCHGQVAKKEVGLRMARKGFAEDTRNYWVGVKKTSKRVYCLAVDGKVQAMALKGTDSGTGGT